jgi:hypothetical protein
MTPYDIGYENGFLVGFFTALTLSFLFWLLTHFLG